MNIKSSKKIVAALIVLFAFSAMCTPIQGIYIPQAPMVSDILDQSVPAGELFTTINLDDHVTDDSADSEITWTTLGETDINVVIDENRVATITYPAGWSGSETITFTATDPDDLSDSDAATFTVDPVNPPPDPIPEFSNIAIPVVTMFGLLLFFYHRRRRE